MLWIKYANEFQEIKQHLQFTKNVIFHIKKWWKREEKQKRREQKKKIWWQNLPPLHRHLQKRGKNIINCSTLSLLPPFKVIGNLSSLLLHSSLNTSSASPTTTSRIDTLFCWITYRDIHYRHIFDERLWSSDNIKRETRFLRKHGHIICSILVYLPSFACPLLQSRTNLLTMPWQLVTCLMEARSRMHIALFP